LAIGAGAGVVAMRAGRAGVLAGGLGGGCCGGVGLVAEAGNGAASR